jgi:hypothetical protein
MGMLARHRQVAEIILSAASGYLVALGGGNALLAYEVTDRPTQDIDVFFGRTADLADAAPAIEAALSAAGYGVTPIDNTAGLTDIWGVREEVPVGEADRAREGTRPRTGTG